MSSKNKVNLLGRLTKDPEVKAMSNGNKVANFTLATSENYTTKAGEKVENTEFHNCVAWSPLAEVIERFVKKGNQIDVEGKLKTRSWEADGGKKYITEIVIRDLVLLGSKDSRTESNQEVSSTSSTKEWDGEGLELPF